MGTVPEKLFEPNGGSDENAPAKKDEEGDWTIPRGEHAHTLRIKGAKNRDLTSYVR